MKRITAWILAVSFALGGMVSEPVAAAVETLGSAKDDQVYQEVFTFTDHEGNVSEPQILCRWEYDDLGRPILEEDQTGKTYGPEGICYTHSFSGAPRRNQDPLHLGNLRQYNYDESGTVCLITYSDTAKKPNTLWQGIPKWDSQGKLISQSVTGADGQYEITYSYDEKGNMTQILVYHENDSGMHYTKYTYEYDADGLLTRESGIQYGVYYYYYSMDYYDPYDYTDASWERTYEYDELGRLVSGTFTDYTWSADMMNYWISLEATDYFTFHYEGNRLTQVRVQCGDILYHRNGTIYKPQKYASYTVDIHYKDMGWNDGLMIFSDTGSLSVPCGGMLALGAAVYCDGNIIGDSSGIFYQVEDGTVLEVESGELADNISYIRLKALKAGTTNVTVTDSQSGEQLNLPVTVYSSSPLCYTLSSVPEEKVEWFTTNFYDVRGVYVDSYQYTVEDNGWATVSFDVYNQNKSYGLVEVYYSDGTLSEAVLIEKMTTGNLRKCFGTMSAVCCGMSHRETS